jgi:hypothetical protein
MSRFLLDCLARRKTDGVLDDPQFKKLRAQYRAILRKGRLLHPRKQGGGVSESLTPGPSTGGMGIRCSPLRFAVWPVGQNFPCR